MSQVREEGFWDFLDLGGIIKEALEEILRGDCIKNFCVDRGVVSFFSIGALDLGVGGEICNFVEDLLGER